MTENLVKISLFYLENEDIQQKMDRKNSKFNVTMNLFSGTEFPCLQNKKSVGFSNSFCHSLPRFYAHPENTDSHLLPQGVNKTSGKILDSYIFELLGNISPIDLIFL